MKDMFVCGYGEDRSQTVKLVAKDVFVGKYGKVESIAAGMDNFDRFNDLPTKNNINYMNSSDKIFVMMLKMKEGLMGQFELPSEVFHMLNIQDIYSYKDSELVKILEEKFIEFMKNN